MGSSRPPSTSHAFKSNPAAGSDRDLALKHGEIWKPCPDEQAFRLEVTLKVANVAAGARQAAGLSVSPPAATSQPSPAGQGGFGWLPSRLGGHGRRGGYSRRQLCGGKMPHGVASGVRGQTGPRGRRASKGSSESAEQLKIPDFNIKLADEMH